jgi:hypothetical protein
MDNKAILEYEYTMTFMLVLILMLTYQIFQVHRPKIATLEKAHKQDTAAIDNLADELEGFNSGAALRFESQDEQRSNFFGGHAAPVFYDIGDVKDTRSARSSNGYTTKTIGGNQVLFKDGERVTSEGMSGSHFDKIESTVYGG